MERSEVMKGRFFQNIVFSPLFLVVVLVCSILLVGKEPFQLLDKYAMYNEMHICYLYDLLDEELCGEIARETIYLIIPALIGIPYLSFIHAEISGKRYRVFLMRSGKDRYIAKHIFQAACSGAMIAGAALFLSLLFSAVILLVKGFPVHFYNVNIAKTEYPKVYAEFAKNGAGWVYFAVRCMAFLCYGAIWPVISTAMAFWTENKYVIAAMPFILSAFLETAADGFSTLRFAMASLTSFEWIRLSNLLGSTEWLFYKAYGGIPCMFFILMAVCGIAWVLARIRIDAIESSIFM